MSRSVVVMGMTRANAALERAQSDGNVPIHCRKHEIGRDEAAQEHGPEYQKAGPSCS